MGSLWRDLHRHRRRAYALCSARSYSVELAAHHFTWHLFGDCGGVAVFHGCCGSAGSVFFVLSCAHSPQGSFHYLDCCVSRGAHATFRGILFSSARIFGGHAPRFFLGSDLARVHGARRIPPGRTANLASLPRSRGAAADCNCDFFGVASQPLLRQYRSGRGGTAIYWIRDGASARCGRGISAGFSSLSSYFCIWSSRRPDGNSGTAAGDRVRLGIGGSLHPVERSCSEPDSSRVIFSRMIFYRMI